jgi:HD-GYP domain-containing protein (c-di-GMP phosphodiesterase class II)
MLIDEQEPTGSASTASGNARTLSSELKSLMERAYGMQFTILDGTTGKILDASPGQPMRDWSLRAEVCRQVVRLGQPEFIDDEDPFLTLALPLADSEGPSTVAVATFVTRQVNGDEDLSPQAKWLGIRPDEALRWACSQTPWTPESLKRISDLVLDNARVKDRVLALQEEASNLSVNLASTYEEISLLCRITQSLRLSESDESLSEVALEWLKDIVPANCLAIQLLPVSRREKQTMRTTRSRSMLVSNGDCPVDNAQFSELIAHLNPMKPNEPIVVNRPTTGQPDWPWPRIRQMIAVALADGEHVFGWLAAFNHTSDGEFGSVEAGLLSSVAAILGIHSGNIDIYRQQSELLAAIVRSLTSAIDAKDSYTCGHSDRVARIAVCLAEELDCDVKTIETLFMAGQLHDIGKIGINDEVLQKAGSLSDDEYEHIKQHVEIGHHILHDLAKLEEVLPVVLHHHETWDGCGYPNKLDSDQIPLAARILAVADAFDAMSSDRPYRKCLPDDNVDRILRAGAGHQWDPQVVAAFFRVREEIRRICREEEAAAR